MNDETLKIPNPPQARPAGKPDSNLLVVSMALVALAAMAVFAWVGDPDLVHAQFALIAALVLSIGAASAVVCHGVRAWIHAAEARTAQQMRCQYYDLSNTIAGLSAELEALKALVGDFIKRYPPVEDLRPDEAAEVRRARSEGYVEGVRNRLTGEGGSVVAWPGQRG
jgi:hypothetical protein